MLLENRVAIVTGGAKGMGRAVCERFAKEGAKVTIADVDMAAAEETVEAIKAAGGQARAVKCDGSKSDQVNREAVAVIHAQFGKLGYPKINKLSVHAGQTVHLGRYGKQVVRNQNNGHTFVQLRKQAVDLVT